MPPILNKGREYSKGETINIMETKFSGILCCNNALRDIDSSKVRSLFVSRIKALTLSNIVVKLKFLFECSIFTI